MPPKEKVHNLAAMMRTGHDDPLPLCNWTKKGRVEWPGKAKDARHYISHEKMLGDEMGMKVKIKSQREMRNGIPRHHGGDKNYGFVDYSPNFFKERGLIAGSSFVGERGDIQAQKMAMASDEASRMQDLTSHPMKSRFLKLQNEEIESVRHLDQHGVDPDLEEDSDEYDDD
uniref:Uncharacterized protein n=1 Tax=Octactis speculum TaxID=3111310 RepID=A0A7S2BQU5_9STRA|mmetsp:Transcript_25869/g.35602  ORF Transcript_25869/g.35602 Transcript_25869/m.35602 type:complete len:171 (+) Transcript_25869:2-514(+)